MKALRFLLLAVATLGLASCLELKSTVSVAKDGSATIEETALVGAQLAAMMQGGGPDAKSPVPDRAKAEERAKSLGEGVTVKSFEELKTPDGKVGAKVVYAVADIRKVTFVPFGMDQGGNKSAPMTFALDGASLTISNPEADKKSDPGAKPKKTPEEIAQMKAQMAMMKPMFAGMRMTCSFTTPGGVSKSDATHLVDGQVIWLDMEMDKVIGNADAFAELMESSDSNLSMTEAAAKFNNLDGLKIEGKKAVTIELK